jgi:hypothetical protein
MPVKEKHTAISLLEVTLKRLSLRKSDHTRHLHTMTNANCGHRRLPILNQPKFIKEALAAGKQVLSEKPIAPTAAEAEALLQWYHKEVDSKKVNWSVAENFRTLGRVKYAAEQAKGLGRLLGFQIHELKFTNDTGKYFSQFHLDGDSRLSLNEI